MKVATPELMIAAHGYLSTGGLARYPRYFVLVSSTSCTMLNTSECPITPEIGESFVLSDTCEKSG